jgi:hypothetical protein
VVGVFLKGLTSDSSADSGPICSGNKSVCEGGLEVPPYPPCLWFSHHVLFSVGTSPLVLKVLFVIALALKMKNI